MDAEYTAHKRGAPRSGLNDEKELGHVANAGTVPADALHARVGREKNAKPSTFPSSVRRKSGARKMSIASISRGINTRKYKSLRDIRSRTHKSINNDAYSLITL